MNTPTNKSEYMLLFRGYEWDKNLSPEELQKVMGDFMGWFERLKAQGKCKAGQPLEREGKVISAKKGISDGPFAESKEAVGGYFLLTVPTFDEAVAIAKECPTLKYGCVLEVRPVADLCPTMRRVNEMAEATA